MDYMVQLVLIFISASLVNNFVLSRFLGICSFLGVSKSRKNSVGMGLAVTFVMALASAVIWLLDRFILQPFNLEFLRTVAFIIVIAALVQFVEMVIKKTSPSLYKALGIYLPLITTNCAVLGVVLINVTAKYDFVSSVVSAIGAALGYFLAIVLLSAIREKTDNNKNIPESFKGLPITLITACIMSIAFLGFQGLIK